MKNPKAMFFHLRCFIVTALLKRVFLPAGQCSGAIRKPVRINIEKYQIKSCQFSKNKL